MMLTHLVVELHGQLFFLATQLTLPYSSKAALIIEISAMGAKSQILPRG